jgi:UDP-2,3-diacylglucosamine pyrophosphatase LpxH
MKVLAFSDLHIPFHNKNKIKKLLKIIKKEKPDAIVNCGDTYDFYMFSKFNKDYNFIKPKEELEKSRIYINNLWDKINKISPKSIKYQLLGNHCIRMFKLIQNNIPSLNSEIKDLYKKYFNYKNVYVKKSDREYIELDGVIYVHGWYSGCVLHMNYFKKPVVHGHNHVPDLCHTPLSKSNYKPLWEMDLGTFANKKLVPFNYTNSIHLKWACAVGIINNGIPKLIKI